MRFALAVMLVFSAAVSGQEASPGANWPSYNNSLDGQRYSQLKQITLANAAQLGEVCRVQIDGPTSFHGGLVVQDGVIYTGTARETVALDATNCALKWKFVYQPEEARCGGSSRGVALLNGRIFRGTCDGRLVALDAATGKLLWKSVIASQKHGESTSGAPLAWGGVVYMGIAGSDVGIRGRVMAYDAGTGRELWRFYTIPMGKETGAETWKRPETAKTGGGGFWGAMTLDVTTGELFVPVGNPWPDIDHAYRPGDNLFTNSILVLDARTGALKWWHQVAPGDWMDLDLAAAPALFRSGTRDFVAIGGKDGYLTVVDRDTHRVAYRTPVTTVEHIHKAPKPEGTRLCPGYAGGVEWNGPALDPANQNLIVGAVDVCFIVKLAASATYKPGEADWGGSVAPDGPATGWITAVNRDTGEVRWKFHAEKPVVAGVTPTAGGVTFAGDLAGNFLVFNSKTGEVVHKARAGGAMAGGVVTYEAGGRQYVAFAAGNISRNAFGDLGLPSVVIMALNPGAAPQRLDVTGSAAAASGPAGTPNLANGRRLYGQICMSCHGADGNMIADRKLQNLGQRRDLAATITYIKDPKAPMPKLFPDLINEQSVIDVANFLHEELK
ncbi:MAG: PQQ-binding-like beta-propeller repeat protein [Proteobacteria bacterium]|nr:PQQ-binding-like beta-propeller repeat protein [Pseudomonadota bacterium]